MGKQLLDGLVGTYLRDRGRLWDTAGKYEQIDVGSQNEDEAKKKLAPTQFFSLQEINFRPHVTCKRDEKINVILRKKTLYFIGALRRPFKV